MPPMSVDFSRMMGWISVRVTSSYAAVNPACPAPIMIAFPFMKIITSPLTICGAKIRLIYQGWPFGDLVVFDHVTSIVVDHHAFAREIFIDDGRAAMDQVGVPDEYISF